MQIFSYVDSNIINSSPKGMSLESLLKSQRPSRVRHHSSIENKSNILSFGTAVANPIPNVASYTKNFTQALSNVLSKIKYVFLVISILYVFALFVIFPLVF